MTATLPYGLRDVKVWPAGGAVDDGIDLPNAQTFSFEESEEFTELRGDDKVVATRGQGPGVAWELGSGGIDLEAYAIINGGEVVVSGVTPAGPAVGSYPLSCSPSWRRRKSSSASVPAVSMS